MAQVSIIVAAYNVADCIRGALDSAVGQTMQDIEIICVDDGSTDNTAEILDEYAARDSRVRVIRHEKNRGLFAVRHTGVMAASGEYVLFLDGDDSYVPHACERLYSEIVSRQLDVLNCGAAMVVSEGCSLDETALAQYAAVFSHAPKKIPENREELLRACFIEEDIRWSMWGKMYSLELLKKAYAFFGGEYVVMAEDVLAMFMIFFYAQAYGYYDECLYCYRFGSGISTSGLPPTVQRLERIATECQVHTLLCKWLTPEQRGEKGVAEALDSLRVKLQNNLMYCFWERANAEDCPAFLKAILRYCTLEEFVFGLAEAVIRERFVRTDLLALRLRNCEELFPRPRTIKTVASFYYRLTNGGLERVIALLAPIWQRAGYQVVIITEESPDPMDYPLPEGVRRAVISERLNSKERMLAWRRIIQEHLIDAVVYHAWLSEGRVMDALAIKAQQVPFILHTHGSSSTAFCEPSVTQTRQEATDALSNVVVTLSEVDQAWWQTLGYRSVCTFNPLTYQPGEIQPSALQGHDVLWMGRLCFEKQYQDAFEIATIVRQAIPDFRLHVVGGADRGEDLEAIREELVKNKMDSYVLLHGFRTDVEKFYQEASAILVTSEYEGAPMVVMESKAFGLPLVTYELPNVAALRKGEGMFIVPQRNRQAAAGKLVQLLENDGLRHKMGDQARRSAEEIARFDFGAHWKSIFEMAVAPRGKHEPLFRQPPMNTALCLAMQKVDVRIFRYERALWEAQRDAREAKEGAQIAIRTAEENAQLAIRTAEENALCAIHAAERDALRVVQSAEADTRYAMKKAEEYEQHAVQVEQENARYAVMVEELQKSTAYRLGRLLTALPRWIKKILGHR